MKTLTKTAVILSGVLIFMFGTIISVIPVQAQVDAQGLVQNNSMMDLFGSSHSAKNPTITYPLRGMRLVESSWKRITSDAAWSARNQHSSVVLPNGSILVMGGIAVGGDLNDVWRSDDRGVTWYLVTDNAEWSARRSHTSLVLPDGSIVLFGGFTQVDGNLISKHDVWRSTTEGETWQLMSDSPEWPARLNTTGVVLEDGSILLIGGGSRNDVWRSDDKGATWTLVTEEAEWERRSNHTSVLLPDGRIIIMGGADNIFEMLNDVWSSDDEGATWSLVTGSAEWAGRYSHTSVVLSDGSIWLKGGWVGNANGEVWHSADGGATWTMLTDDPAWTARYSHTSVVLLDGSILLIGGYFETSQNDVWRIRTLDSNEIFLPLILR